MKKCFFIVAITLFMPFLSHALQTASLQELLDAQHKVTIKPVTINGSAVGALEAWEEMGSHTVRSVGGSLCTVLGFLRVDDVIFERVEFKSGDSFYIFPLTGTHYSRLTIKGETKPVNVLTEVTCAK